MLNYCPPAELPEAQGLVQVLKCPALLLKHSGEPALRAALAAGLDFVGLYARRAVGWWGRPALEALTAGDRSSAYAGAYDAVHEVIRVEEAGYDAALAAAAALQEACVRHDGTLDLLPDAVNRFIALYRTATSLLPRFTKLVQDVATAADAEPQVAPLKAGMRLLEKEVLRPGAGVPWDVVRAQVEVGSMAQLSAALEALGARRDIRLHAVNDRFSRPAAGWSDVAVYFSFDDAEVGSVVAELQLVHAKLMLIRRNLGAHDMYDSVRFAAELLRQTEARAPPAESQMPLAVLPNAVS